MTAWLGHGPLGSPGGGYGYGGLVLGPFNVHVPPTRATSLSHFDAFELFALFIILVHYYAFYRLTHSDTF